MISRKGDIMIEVKFNTMPTIDGTGEQNAMWCMVMVDGEEIELYAFDVIPEGEDNYNGDFLGDSYLRLVAEISEQAENLGIDPDSLEFPWG